MARPKKVTADKNDNKLKGHIAVLMAKEKQYREKAQQLTDENNSLKKEIAELNKFFTQIDSLVANTHQSISTSNSKTKTKAKAKTKNKTTKSTKSKGRGRPRKSDVTEVAITAPKKGKRGRPRKSA